MKRVFEKYENNPILKAGMLPAARYVLNPGAVKFRDEYIIMMDVITLAQPVCFWIARSRDGVNFVPDKEPVNWPKSDPDHPEDCVYDPRITKIDDDYFICYASSNCKYGVRVGIVKTRDFISYERVSIASEQGNRNAVLFPEKIGGYYVRLDRPFGSERDTSGIWMSYSPDLVFWGKSKPLLDVREGLWDSLKVGGGPVPIKTEKGWLTIYHGVSESCNGFMYCLGVCLLDLNDPSKVIARCEDAILWPEEEYELKGRVDNVVFACNAIVEDDKTVKIYYGAADTCIGLATTTIDDLISACYSRNIFIFR